MKTLVVVFFSRKIKYFSVSLYFHGENAITSYTDLQGTRMDNGMIVTYKVIFLLPSPPPHPVKKKFGYQNRSLTRRIYLNHKVGNSGDTRIKIKQYLLQKFLLQNRSPMWHTFCMFAILQSCKIKFSSPLPYTPINCKTHPSTPGNGASLVKR